MLPVHSVSATVLAAGLALAAGAARSETNPHDGYAFWLPNGTLKVGDPASEKAFDYKREGTSVTFTVPLRKTRFDTPSGNLVVIPSPGAPVKVAGAVDAGGVYFAARAAGSAADVQVTLQGKAAPKAYRFYFTDDARAWAPLAGMSAMPAGSREYHAGLSAFWRGAIDKARPAFQKAAERANDATRARMARRFVRWCDAELRYPKIARADAKGYYDLGLYAMVNGFWELAERSFKASTAANPKDPDAWYMLGDAASYVHSDLDGGFAQVYPYYKKAADLYPRANSNTFRNQLGLFKKLRVKEGDREEVLTLTPQQIAETKLKWEWCTAVFEAASRGSMRMVNNWVEYDQEFDNTAPMGHDPAPYEGLWQPGTTDTFMKFTGWGASDAIGPDCGPNRSASVNIGMREWDVLYHEWNHTLDWLMAFTGMGIGVPETHSSDWCGFQPISSMGMGHHSCNRYYMTPGMYRAIHGSDAATTPWIEEWLISDPVSLGIDYPNPVPEPLMNQGRAAAAQVASPLSPDNVPASGQKWAEATAMDGYVDLLSIERKAAPASYSFAHVYVWSPSDRVVRIWYGADDNARIWVNNKLAYSGIYWSVAKWEEAREKDQICFSTRMRRGWNSVLMQVTNVPRAKPSDNPPHPFWYGRPDQWGFSMRLCDLQNQPIDGMRWQAQRPPMFDAKRLTPLATIAGMANPRPAYFSWNKVKDDYTQDLPHLSLADLRALTGYQRLAVTNEMLFDPGLPVQTPSGAVYPYPEGDPKAVKLDNELNWFFSPKEMVAALRYTDRKGVRRDLVFLRPEMYEAFTRLARVSPDARKRGIKSHADRVIGYFTVPRPDSPNGRIVLALDTWLGEKPPVDEEDLLSVGAGK